MTSDEFKAKNNYKEQNMRRCKFCSWFRPYDDYDCSGGECRHPNLDAQSCMCVEDFGICDKFSKFDPRKIIGQQSNKTKK